MNYNAEKRELVLGKELSELDRFVLDFIKILQKQTDYVIVSGYVSIIFGRTRATEDVDLLVPKMNKEKFIEVFETFLKSGYECANTSVAEEAFKMLNEHAIRFYEAGFPIPNVEFKQIKTDLDRYSFENRIKVILPNGELYLSPIEMQIAYKLYLSSEKGDKDIEDARHLYKLFDDKINKGILLVLAKKLKVENKIKELE